MCAMLEDNIFLKIINREIPADIVFEDELSLAFRDISPQAPNHILIIPKKVIPTHDDIEEADKELIGHLHIVAQKLAAELGADDGYRVVINCREAGGQVVPHLHFHLLTGRQMNWPPG